ncbi:MAG: hypothetical protein ACOXZR_02270 [Bacilli bacterium]
MKVLRFIKKMITGILGIAFFTFAIAMALLLLNYNDYKVSQIDKTSFIIIRDTIAADRYEKGDLVLVEEKKIEEISEGDELFVYVVGTKGIEKIELGVVSELHYEENAITFKNGSTYLMKFVAGEAKKVYPELGTYLSVITSQWGFLFIILVPCFLIFISQVYALVIEIKYGGQEENLS